MMFVYVRCVFCTAHIMKWNSRYPPLSEAVRWTWAAHCLLVCRTRWGAESEKPAPPGQRWRGRGWWRESTGWKPEQILWPLGNPQGSPHNPLDIVPVGTGTSTSSPEPCFSFSSSLQECEELGETRVNNWVFHLIYTYKVKNKLKFLHFSFCWKWGVYGEKSTHSTTTWRMLATAFNVEGTWIMNSKQKDINRNRIKKIKSNFVWHLFLDNCTCGFPSHPPTFKASLSIDALIFAQNSSQQMFSSAVTTSAEQRANTLYSLDHADSIDFCAAWTKRHQNQAVKNWI